MLDGNDSLLMTHERLQSVFQRAPITLSVSVLNAILIAIVLRPLDGDGLAGGWVAAITAVSAVRWAVGRQFRRCTFDAVSSRRWVLFSVGGALLTGLLWGAGAVVLFPAAQAYQFFLALVVGGMCAGSVAVNATHLPTVLAFLLPASLLLAARLFVLGGVGQVSALMVAIFATALTVIGLAGHRAFGDRIRLQIALDQEQRKFGLANQRLLEEIAQRQAAEATLHQAQKMEAIGHLTGGLAHDFNNLLQVLIGNIDMIRRLTADDPRTAPYVHAAEQAALRGSELTSSLLSFARRQTLRADLVDVNALLRDFEPVLVGALSAEIRFGLDLAADLPACRADPTHFQSAVLNLVINARDAMPDGGVLSVATSVATLDTDDLAGNPDANPGRFVSVSVRDTGCGMSPEVMRHVFEPFFTTKEVGKGSGLGLSQVFGFARQSHGHIRLVSAPDDGTEATLLLPVSATEAEAGRTIPGNAPEGLDAPEDRADPDQAAGVGDASAGASGIAGPAAPRGAPGDVPGDVPRNDAGHTTGNRPGNEPGDASEDMPGDAPGDMPRNGAGHAAGNRPGDEPEPMPGDAPGDMPRNDVVHTPGNRPGNEPEPMLGNAPSPGGRSGADRDPVPASRGRRHPRVAGASRETVHERNRNRRHRLRHPSVGAQPQGPAPLSV